MTKALKINLLIIIALLCNGIVIFTTIINSTKLSEAHSALAEGVNENVTLLLQLKKLERTIGYVGFIHNFKNYIIRKDVYYFEHAVQDYQTANQLIKDISKNTTQPRIVNNLETIKYTLDEYYDKLQFIKEHKRLTVEERDKLVKVDDQSAADAINNIINFIEPNIANSNSIFIDKVEQQIEQAYGLSIFVSFIILSFTYLVIRYINTQKEALDKFNQLINASPDAIIHADNNGQIITVNKAACDLFEYTQSEFKNHTIEDLVPKETIQQHKSYRHEFTKRNQSREMRAGLKIFGVTKSGQSVPLQIAIGSFGSNNVRESISVIRDMRTIEGLSEDKQYLSEIINALTSYKIILDIEGNIVDMNRTLCELLGKQQSDFHQQKLWRSEFWSNQVEDIDKIKAALATVHLSGKPARFDSHWFINPDIIDVDISITNFTTNKYDAPLFIVSAIDISDRKAYEQKLMLSEANFRQVIEQTSDILIVFRDTGIMEWSNEKGLELFQSSLEEIHKLNLFTVLSEEDKLYFTEHLHGIENAESAHSPTFTVDINTCSSTVPVEVTLTPYDDSDQTLYLATISDLSDLLKTNEQLEELLDEKNALLNEVHHRVKNNLQVINSLLQLQQHHVSKELAAELKIYQQRVRSVALVHQLLYEQNEFSSIDFVSYLDKLGHLILIDGVQKPIYKVNFDLPPHEIYLPIKQTIPLGLIVNEVLTNVMKYAFKEYSPDNLVTIALSLNTEHIHLKISDNGIGMDLDKYSKSDSLGHTLIELFTKQAIGSYEIDSKNGTTFNFQFDLEKNTRVYEV